MPQKTDAQFATAKQSDEQKAKSNLSTIMDEAPLFAGLDDFVLRPVKKLKAESEKAGTVKEKRQAVSRRTKPALPVQPATQITKKSQKMPSTETAAILLSVNEICALLKISRATLVRMDKAGQLPGRIKLGGSVRFHKETVEKWLHGLIELHPS